MTVDVMTPVERIEALRFPINDGPFGLSFAELREAEGARVEIDGRAFVIRYSDKQPRWPKGSPGGMGGKWAKLGDVLQAITNLLAGEDADKESPMLKQLQDLADLLSSGDGGGSAKPVAPKATKKPKAKKSKLADHAPTLTESLEAIEKAIAGGDDKTSTTTDIKGVTLEPGGFGLKVKYHGVDIGNMGQNASDGSWTAFPPSNMETQYTSMGMSSKSTPAWPIIGQDPEYAGHTLPTKEQAIQALVDSYNAHVLGQAVLTGTVPDGSSSKKKVALVPVDAIGALEVGGVSKLYASDPETVMVNGKSVGHVYQDADSGKWGAVSLDGGVEISGLDSKMAAVEMVVIQQGEGLSTMDLSGVKDAPAKAPLGPADLTQTTMPQVLLEKLDAWSASVTYTDGLGDHQVGMVYTSGGHWVAVYPDDSTSSDFDTKDQAIEELIADADLTAPSHDSDLQTGVAGATLSYTGQSGHLGVKVGGKNVGTVYDSPVGQWIAFSPGSAVGTSHASKDDAIEALITDFQLENPGVLDTAGDKKPAPKLPKGKKVTVSEGIDHVKEDDRKLIFSLYKAQITGQLISSPAADNYDNLIAIGHLHGLTPLQVAEVIDDQWSKNWKAGNTGVLKKKIKDWLATPEGAAYAKAHKKPKPDLVAKMAGKGSTPKGVKLKPGQKVQAVSGPGGYKPGDTTHYKKIDSKAMQASQKAYMDAHGISLTPAQLEAVQNYTGGGYSSMNGYLRGTHESVGPQTKQHVVQLQSAMMPLQESILLLRGAGWEHFPPEFRKMPAAKKLVGKSVTWPEFVSTSVAGSGGQFSGAVHFEIEAPAGTSAIFARPWSIHKSENEVVLPAGTKFRVMSVTPSGGYGPTVIRMRVVTPK